MRAGEIARGDMFIMNNKNSVTLVTESKQITEPEDSCIGLYLIVWCTFFGNGRMRISDGVYFHPNDNFSDPSDETYIGNRQL